MEFLERRNKQPNHIHLSLGSVLRNEEGVEQTSHRHACFHVLRRRSMGIKDKELFFFSLQLTVINGREKGHVVMYARGERAGGWAMFKAQAACAQAQQKMHGRECSRHIAGVKWQVRRRAKCHVLK